MAMNKAKKTFIKKAQMTNKVLKRAAQLYDDYDCPTENCPISKCRRDRCIPRIAKILEAERKATAELKAKGGNK